MAEEFGVIADPEITIRSFEPDDRYIVIASDGVFEFLTSQVPFVFRFMCTHKIFYLSPPSSFY